MTGRATLRGIGRSLAPLGSQRLRVRY
jgi:hypothetical protein